MSTLQLDYIAGDEPRQDTDWGLHQLDTVRSVLMKLGYIFFFV
jgi:hypothetical protein